MPRDITSDLGRNLSQPVVEVLSSLKNQTIFIELAGQCGPVALEVKILVAVSFRIAGSVRNRRTLRLLIPGLVFAYKGPQSRRFRHAPKRTLA